MHSTGTVLYCIVFACVLQELERSQTNGTAHRQVEEEKLRNTKLVISNKYKQAKQKCETYEVEIDNLRKKLRAMTDEVCSVYVIQW